MAREKVDKMGIALAQALKHLGTLDGDDIGGTEYIGKHGDEKVQVYFRSGRVMRLFIVDMTGIDRNPFRDAKQPQRKEVRMK